MSKIISEINEAWNKKSWINDFTSNAGLNKSLTEEYAEDVLQAVGEGYQNNLSDAIADLQKRVGLTIGEVSEIKRVAIAMVKEINSPIIKEAKGMNPGFRKYLDEKKKNKPAGTEESKEDDKPKEEGKESKEEVASISNIELMRLAKKDKKKFNEVKATLTNKESIEYAKKLEAWFQGSDEKTVEGPITSNNPETLGYPNELAYPHKPMETAVGGDSRDWEQKKFEGEAKDTKKVMGPSGTELELKEKMQRAKRLERLNKIVNASSTTSPEGKQWDTIVKIKKSEDGKIYFKNRMNGQITEVKSVSDITNLLNESKIFGEVKPAQAPAKKSPATPAKVTKKKADLSQDGKCVCETPEMKDGECSVCGKKA